MYVVLVHVHVFSIVGYSLQDLVVFFYQIIFRQVHLTSETLEYNLFQQKCARETVMMSGHWFPPHSPSQHSSIHCQTLFEE